MVRVFTNGPGDQDSIPVQVIPKTQKRALNATLSLSIISYRSRASGAIQEKELCPLLHLGVQAIEKGAFGSPSTTVSQFMYIYIYIYMCVCVCY